MGQGCVGEWARWWWPGGCLTAPLLSAGEAFLGSFVASGMGPSASSHGSPVPLPSDLSFRSPTPSNLPMVQLWAAHAHEGKERARRVGLRAAGPLSPVFSILPTPSTATVNPPGCGPVRPIPGHSASLLFFKCSVLPLVVTGPLHELFPLLAAPYPAPPRPTPPHWLSPFILQGSAQARIPLLCDDGFVCLYCGISLFPPE